MTVAIIGCGSSGSAIASQLVVKKNIKKLTLVDDDLKKIKKLVTELSKIDKKLECSIYKINARKTTDLIQNLRDIDVIINASSPLCNIPIMKACLKTKSNYLDLASDPFSYPGINKDTTLDSQLELNKPFINENLIAITNAGASPGFSDLLVKYISEKHLLDEILKIGVYFIEIVKSEKFIASWSPYTLLLETMYPATIFKDNKIIELENNQRKKIIQFSKPFGKMEIMLFNGHPELRTIPDFLKIPIRYIEVGGGFMLNNLDLENILLEAMRRILNKSPLVKGNLIEILASSFEKPDKFLKYFKDKKIEKDIISCLVEIEGKNKNKKIKYKVSSTVDLEKIFNVVPLSTASSFMVSIVPSVLTDMILQNKISEKGVIAPAALSNASDIINECKRYKIDFNESYHG